MPEFRGPGDEDRARRLGELVMAGDYHGLLREFGDSVDPLAMCLTPDGRKLPLINLAIAEEKSGLVQALWEEGHLEKVSDVLGALLASRDAMFELLEEMILAGATPQEAGGTTPLHEAAREGSVRNLSLLLAFQKDVDAENAEGRTPLLVAVVMRQTEAALALLAAGADMMHPDRHGLTPLEAMLTSQHRTFRRVALDWLQNHRWDGGKMPFDVAALLAKEHPSIWERFRDSIDPAAAGPQGETLLFHAGSVEVARWLADRGVAPCAADSHGRTALHAACGRGAPPSLVRWLVHMGCDPRAQDGDGMTPLHHAALSGAHDIAALLLSMGADPMAVDSSHNTPLHYAAASLAPGASETVELLLEAGADPNMRGGGGRTPLVWAAKARFAQAAYLLRKHGADPSLPDGTGMTAVAVAFQQKDPVTAAACSGEEPDLVPQNIRRLLGTVDRFQALMDGMDVEVEPFLLLYPTFYDDRKIGQVGGAPVGIDEDSWPRTSPELLEFYARALGGDRDWRDDHMEHVITVEISELTNLAPSLPEDVVAVAFFHPRPDAAFLRPPGHIPAELTHAVVPITRQMVEEGRHLRRQPVRHSMSIPRRGVGIFRVELPVVLRWITSSREDIDGCMSAPELERHLLERVLPPAFEGDELHALHAVPFVMDLVRTHPRQAIRDMMRALYDMYADVTWISYAGIYATWIGSPEGNEQEYVFQFGDDLVPEMNVLGGLTYVFANEAVIRLGTRRK